jgi:hypothetical protein
MSVVNIWDRNDRSIDHSSIDRDTYFTARDKNEGEFIRAASTKLDFSKGTFNMHCYKHPPLHT